jgi:hypothetical protein
MEEGETEMKYNLKTFPKMVADSTTNEQEVIVWKNGFEKELKEELIYAKNAEIEWRGQGNKPHPIDEKIAREWHGIIIAIKQVLGEEKE